MAATVSDGLPQPSRPIERLPVRRLSNEPREAMNCKSCRKRKIKCNRLRPSCEACKVFNVECIYDAIPKKRGPKTDVLESLLKRVNGLEKRLKDDGDDAPSGPNSNAASTAQPHRSSVSPGSATAVSTSELPRTAQVAGKKRAHRASDTKIAISTQASDYLPTKQEPHTPGLGSVPSHPNARFQTPIRPYHTPVSAGLPQDALLDLYFERLHGKPFYILDEAATRQRCRTGQLPGVIVDAIHAVAARYGDQLLGGYNAATRVSEECCARARMVLDCDEPTIENLQTSLLLAIAFFKLGRSKKSYMLLSSAISMALALGLHRELPTTVRVPVAEREGRRKLFWTCYLMDRFTAAGSKRPSIIADEAISLRLPAGPHDGGATYQEGPYFSNGSNLPVSGAPIGRMGFSSNAALIDITRLLGITNRYLAAGGVKGDSHFPWHQQSNLSKVRQDLEMWAGTNPEVFMSNDGLFSQPDGMIIVLARLVYHLIHCLIYRPFLPVDLIELAGTEQHQPWQLEATNVCFLHANAIASLVEVGRACSVVDWPSFVSYCLFTAGTVHVHGAHYAGRVGDFFARSAEYLSKEMTLLQEIRVQYAAVQHQTEVLQTMYGCHSELVKSLATNPMRFSPVFQMEDFFDRYPGRYLDGAHVTLRDVSVEQLHESLAAYNGLKPPSRDGWMASQSTKVADNSQGLSSPSTKRRRTNEYQGQIGMAGASNGQEVNSSEEMETGDFAAQSSLPTPTEITDHGLTVPEQQTLSQNPLSPNFSFSPWPMSFANTPAEARQTLAPAPDMRHQLGGKTDNTFTFGLYDHQTPGGLSATGSVPSETEIDPFLSLLEQLAENENSQLGGPSDLDFFLSGQGGLEG